MCPAECCHTCRLQVYQFGWGGTPLRCFALSNGSPCTLAGALVDRLLVATRVQGVTEVMSRFFDMGPVRHLAPSFCFFWLLVCVIVCVYIKAAVAYLGHALHKWTCGFLLFLLFHDFYNPFLLFHMYCHTFLHAPLPNTSASLPNTSLPRHCLWGGPAWPPAVPWPTA